MAQFKLKQQEKEIVGKATFNKADDFKVVVLLDKKTVGGKEVVNKSEPKVLHVIQAERLIKKGKAEEVKGAKFEAKKTTRTVKKIEE